VSTRRALPVVALGALALAVVYAEPLQDGDVFWHLTYGQQMLDRHTLRLDHSLYSWMPDQTDTIYCAWAAELLLLGLWRLFGFTGLYVLRYLVLAGVLALLWRHAWRRGLGRSAVTAVVLLLVALSVKAGTVVKPELLSLLLFTALVHLWHRARQADRAGADARRWLAAVPALLLVWANTHGGFVLAVPFLVATAVGEVVNARFSPASALTARHRRWLLGSWAGCLLAVCATPYGPAYPIQLVGDYVLDPAPRPDTAWNVSHRPIWDSSLLGLHLLEYGALFAGLLAAAVVWAVRRHRLALDVAGALAVLVYVPLYVLQLRTTYFLPVVAAAALFEVVGTDPAPVPAAEPVGRAASRRDRAAPSAHRPAVTAVALVGFLALGARAAVAAYAAPPAGSWLGFGESYVNPVVEADYLEREGLGPRLYNIFDSGGYLLWRLEPEVEVMVDSRSFPYLSWFGEQRAFADGRDVPGFVARRRRGDRPPEGADLARVPRPRRVAPRVLRPHRRGVRARHRRRPPRDRRPALGLGRRPAQRLRGPRCLRVRLLRRRLPGGVGRPRRTAGPAPAPAGGATTPRRRRGLPGGLRRPRRGTLRRRGAAPARRPPRPPHRSP
jgi:hypothetical protein